MNLSCLTVKKIEFKDFSSAILSLKILQAYLIILLFMKFQRNLGIHALIKIIISCRIMKLKSIFVIVFDYSAWYPYARLNKHFFRLNLMSETVEIRRIRIIFIRGGNKRETIEWFKLWINVGI